MTFTHNVIIFCFSICLTSCITASKSSDLDYLTSLLNDQDDESEAIDGTFRNINFKKIQPFIDQCMDILIIQQLYKSVTGASDEDTSNVYIKNSLGPYARSRWPKWLYSIPRPVQRIKRKQHLVNLLARMNKRNKIGSWFKTMNSF